MLIGLYLAALTLGMLGNVACFLLSDFFFRISFFIKDISMVPSACQTDKRPDIWTKLLTKVISRQQTIPQTISR